MKTRLIYIANDGEEFDEEVNCLEYEESCRIDKLLGINLNLSSEVMGKLKEYFFNMFEEERAKNHTFVNFSYDDIKE